MKLSEKDQQAAFVALLLIAFGTVAFAFFFVEPADSLSDGKEFYSRLSNSGSAGILYDVRDAKSDAQVSYVYQCGVDIISKGRLAGKSLENIACDSEGCISASTATNGTNKMTYEQAKKKLSQMPYILIKAGAPSYQFYQRHMEISIGENITEWNGCDISATES